VSAAYGLVQLDLRGCNDLRPALGFCPLPCVGILPGRSHDLEFLTFEPRLRFRIVQRGAQFRREDLDGSVGAFFGTAMFCHEYTTILDNPASCIIGTSGKDGSRCSLVTTIVRSVLDWM